MKQLTPDFFVTEQIAVDDLAEAAAKGIRTVICNRPDAEAPDQPPTEALAKAAADAGLNFVHIPVVAGAVEDSDIDAFAETCRNADAPILAYCRTGTRSACLWALDQAGSQDIDTIVHTAAKAGYDISGLKPRMQARN